MRPAVRTRRPARLAAAAATLALLGLLIGSASADAAGPTVNVGRHLGASASPAAAAKPRKGPSPLIDHGGPVLTSSRTHLIFWGDFTTVDSDLTTAMPLLFGGFGGSSYLGIAQQYMRGASISSTYVGARSDSSAPPSHAPTASALGAEAQKVWGPVAAADLYVVFTSNLPHVSYCAWHDTTTVNGTQIEVAYIPLQPHGCSPYTVSNLGANTYSETTVAAADSAAHEFMESVTDPQLNAWYDGQGGEVADKCNYNYQSVVTLGNHTTWQIQSEWSNAIGGCQQS